MKGEKKDWEGLPKTKSLFYTKPGKGLPIGNLTSQLFGNVYLNDFDHFIKYKLRCKYYGRYVDDFIIIHPDKEYLKSIIPLLNEFLKKRFALTLHPKKIYLQHFSKGVSFLGVNLKPHRIYICNRTKGTFFQVIQFWNRTMMERKKLSNSELETFISSVNSYLGMLKHYNTYKLRRKMLQQNLSAYFWNYVYISNNYGKLVKKRRPAMM